VEDYYRFASERIGMGTGTGEEEEKIERKPRKNREDLQGSQER